MLYRSVDNERFLGPRKGGCEAHCICWIRGLLDEMESVTEMMAFDQVVDESARMGCCIKLEWGSTLGSKQKTQGRMGELLQVYMLAIWLCEPVICTFFQR